MQPERRAQLFQVVERITRIPMLVLALAMIPLLLGPVFLQLPPQTEALFVLLDTVIWALFALELGVKTYLAPSHFGYLRENWIDVVIVALPIFRPFRLLRFLRLGLFAIRAVTDLRSLILQTGLGYTLAVGILLTVLCAGLVAIVEQEAEGPIQSFTDALWWAAVTVTTVGYGDKYPVTPEGRVLAVVLMLVGISLFGIIAARLAAFFVQGSQDKELHAKVDALLTRMERLEASSGSAASESAGQDADAADVDATLRAGQRR